MCRSRAKSTVNNAKHTLTPRNTLARFKQHAAVPCCAKGKPWITMRLMDFSPKILQRWPHINAPVADMHHRRWSRNFNLCNVLTYITAFLLSRRPKLISFLVSLFCPLHTSYIFAFLWNKVFMTKMISRSPYGICSLADVSDGTEWGERFVVLGYTRTLI